MKNILKLSSLLSLLATALVIGSCSVDDPDEPDPIEPPYASFSLLVDETNTMKVVFTNASIDGESFAWDFGDGQGASDEENPTYTYTASGTYTVKLTVTNQGGTDSFEDDVTVSGFGENLITNGDFSSIEGWTSTALWTAEDNATEHGIVDGEFMFKNGADASGNSYEYSNHMLYTKVELIDGATYKFDADMKSPSGTNGVWFEVYLLDNEPLEEPDGELAQFFIKSYGEGENCGSVEFDGKMLEIAKGCSNNAFDKLISDNGTFTVTANDIGADNTAYLVIKTGSGWGPDGSTAGFLDGIFIDNISIQQAL